MTKQALIAATIILTLTTLTTATVTDASTYRVNTDMIANSIGYADPTGEVSLNVTPPGCVDASTFETSTGFYGVNLESSPNTCINVVDIIINGHSIPKLDLGCRREVRLDPTFQPYLALEPGSRAEIKLVIVGKGVSEDCLVEIEIKAPSTSSVENKSNHPTIGKGPQTGVYGWLGGTPLRTYQHHRLKALVGSWSVALIVGSAWLAVVVKRVCGS